MRTIVGTLVLTFAVLLIAEAFVAFSGIYEQPLPTRWECIGSWTRHGSAQSGLTQSASPCRQDSMIRPTS